MPSFLKLFAGANLITQCTSTSFLHLTDIHLDLDYHVGAPNKCVLGKTGLGCCRSYDIPLSGSAPAGEWGDPNCDTPFSLVNATLAWIVDNIPDLEFVTYSGDTVGHHDLSQSISKNVNTLSTTASLFHTHFPNIPVLPNQGNHDTYPIDQTLPGVTTYMRNQLADEWAPLMSTSTAQEFYQQGYYAYPISAYLTVVSIDTLQYDSNNIARKKDFGPQLEWLRGIIGDARSRGTKILLIGHIFPSAGESTPMYSNTLLDILHNSSDVIIGNLFGHSHKDQFLVSSPDVALLVSPSIMPDARDPCFRIYSYLDTLIDYDQYCVDLARTNQQNALYVYHDYGFADTYGVLDISATSLIDVAKRLPHDSILGLDYCYHYFNMDNNTLCTPPKIAELTNEIVLLS